MNKVPVGATLARSFGFIRDNYPALLGITWLPTAAIIGSMFWALVPMTAIDPGDPMAAMTHMGNLLVFEVLTFLATGLMCIGITKLALGKLSARPFIYLTVDADFGRLLLGWFLFAMIFIAITIAITVPVTIMAATNAGGDPAVMQAELQSRMIYIIAGVYLVAALLGTRLASLLPAIAVCEKKTGMGRNWTLTHGNFWRLLTILLCVAVLLLIPPVLLYGGIALAGGPSVLDAFGSQTAQLQWSRDTMNFYLRWWYVFAPAWLLVTPLFQGLLFGASAFAYRALVPEEPARPAA